MIKLTEMDCEDRIWMELAQDHVHWQDLALVELPVY